LTSVYFSALRLSENIGTIRHGSSKSRAKFSCIKVTDCRLGGRVHPQIAWAKLRCLCDGAGTREQEAVELNARAPVRDERKKNVSK
jgi:hypothetical protein